MKNVFSSFEFLIVLKSLITSILHIMVSNMQSIGKSITPLNLRMNIQRKRKSGCEFSTDHFRNVCKNETFSIQVIEKLPENG